MNTTFRGNKPLFPRGPGLGLRTLTLCFLSLAMILADQRTEQLQGLRAALSMVMHPVVWLASAPQGLARVSDWLVGRQWLLEENEELRREQLELRARLQTFDALEAENGRIRELLASADKLEDRVLMTEIIGISQDPYRSQVMLNKGAREGVYRGQALVDAFGILGQVIEVRSSTSTALLITDPEHGIPVEINRTGFRTIALGRGDGVTLDLPYLPGSADVRVGDLLVSSALGGRFPAGYPVGEVIEVKYQAGEQFMKAVATPRAHLNQGRQALLVWSESYPVDEPPPTADAALPEPAQ